MPKGSAPQSPQPYNAYSPFGSTTFTPQSGSTPGSETISFSPQTERYINNELRSYGGLTGQADRTIYGTPARAATPDVFTKDGHTVDVRNLNNKARIDQLQDQGYKLTKQGTAAQAGTPGELPSQPFSTAGLPYNPSSVKLPDPSTFQGQADKAAQAAFAEEKGMLQPGFDQQQRQLETSLSDRGIPLGSEIDKNERNLLSSQQNNAYQQAAQGAVLAGNQEQQALFGEANTGANTELGINSQAMQQALTQRELPFNETSAYLSGQPVTFGATPQFQNVQPLQIAGYQGAMNQYNQGQSALSNGLFGIGSAALSAFAPSKRDYKKDITKIGQFDKGLNIYSYRYKGEDDDAPVRVGVMADEVKGFSPWAVHEDMPDGVTRVDYGAVVEAMQ